MEPKNDGPGDNPERPWVLGWALFAIVIALLATLVFGW
jgi:hypothetical protein